VFVVEQSCFYADLDGMSAIAKPNIYFAIKTVL